MRIDINYICWSCENTMHSFDVERGILARCIRTGCPNPQEIISGDFDAEVSGSSTGYLID